MQVLVLPWKSTKMVLICTRGLLILHHSLTAHWAEASPGYFTYAVCNGMLHPSQRTVSMRTRLCGSKVLRALLLLQILQKQDWILSPPHTYVCIVSAQKYSSPRSESSDLNGPLYSGLHKCYTHLQILRVSHGASWCLLRHELSVDIIYLAEWTNAQTNEPHHPSAPSDTHLSSLHSAFPVVKASGKNWQNSFHKTHETH